MLLQLECITVKRKLFCSETPKHIATKSDVNRQHILFVLRAEGNVERSIDADGRSAKHNVKQYEIQEHLEKSREEESKSSSNWSVATAIKQRVCVGVCRHVSNELS